MERWYDSTAQPYCTNKINELNYMLFIPYLRLPTFLYRLLAYNRTLDLARLYTLEHY